MELLGARRIVTIPAERDLEALARHASALAAAVARDDRDPRPSDPAFCRRCPARRYCPRATPDPLPLAAAPPRTAPAQLQLFDA